VIPGSSPAAQAAAASSIWRAASSTAPKKKAAAAPAPAPSGPGGPSWPTWVPWALGIGGVAAAVWFMKRKGGGGRARRNPLFAGGGEDRDAVKFYKNFHWGRKPKKFKRVKASPRPRRLVQLGVLEAVTYSAKKGADALADYIHHFGEGGTKRPILAADPSNRRLHILGGGYDVRPEGITG